MQHLQIHFIKVKGNKTVKQFKIVQKWIRIPKNITWGALISFHSRINLMDTFCSNYIKFDIGPQTNTKTPQLNSQPYLWQPLTQVVTIHRSPGFSGVPESEPRTIEPIPGNGLGS